MAGLKFIICSSEFAGEASSVYMKSGDPKHIYTIDNKIAYEQLSPDLPSPSKIFAEIQDNLNEAISEKDSRYAELTVILSPCGLLINDYRL